VIRKRLTIVLRPWLDARPATAENRAEEGMAAPGERVTHLLQAWNEGDVAARDRLISVLYRDLRRRAAAHLRRGGPQPTLRPTELVNEAYIRLVAFNDRWQNRGQFFGIASELMRRILVDRARAHRAAKRSGNWPMVTLDRDAVSAPPVDVDVLDLDVALTELAAFDARKSRIVELRFFGGLSLEESAETLGISRATAERDWQVARAWLFDRLSGSSGRDA